MAEGTSSSSAWLVTRVEHRVPWPAARAALARATEHLKLNRERLCDPYDDRYPICSLIVAEMGHKKWSMGRWLGRRLATVKAFYGEALASKSCPTSSSGPPLAPRLVQWLQSAKPNSILVVARVRRVLSLVGKNPCYGVRYL
jgi:hypothetical protein